MNKKNKVSIILPVYNVERYLVQCMESLFAQTLSEIEIIAVNDGSTDHSLDILKQYQKQHPYQLRIFSIKNQGVSHARNYGLKKAIGEYIQFVDSDDFIEPDMCEKLYNKAKLDGNDIVICGRYNIFENKDSGELIQEVVETQLINRNFSLSEHKYELAHISPFPWDKLFKRSLLEGIFFPLGIRFEDLVFVYETVCKSESIGVVEEPLYNYRRTTEGGFLNSFSEQTLDIITAFQYLFDYMKKNGFWDFYYEELEFICSRHFLNRYGSFFKPENKGKLTVKKKILNETHNFLNNNLDQWNKNRYLRYSTTPEMRKKLKLYTHKKRMLQITVLREFIPEAVIQLMKKCRDLVRVWKSRIYTLRQATNRKELLKKTLPFVSLILKDNATYYTKLYDTLPVISENILLESKHGEDLGSNIFALLQELSKREYQNHHILLSMDAKLIPRYRKLLRRYRIVNVNFIEFNTNAYLKALATSKYLITDTSFPTYFIKRRNQVLLNTWHGTPLKAMGRIVPSREYALGNIQRNFLISDYLIYQNDFSRDIFLRDYMIRDIYKGKALSTGYPRNSTMLRPERYEEIRKDMGIQDKQVIAYLPTWRGLLTKKENGKQIHTLMRYFGELDKKLSDHQIFYIKLHTYVTNEISYEGFRHIKAFPTDYDTYDFLSACDMLVTDYSSVMFDFAVTKRKLILFAYDKEEYLDQRGLYLDLNTMELPVVSTISELIREINSNQKSYSDFYERFCSKDSIYTSKQVCHMLLKDKSKKYSKLRDGRKKVLIFIPGLDYSSSCCSFIDDINLINTDKYNVFLCMRADRAKDATEVLSRLNPKIGYIPLSSDLNFTKSDYIYLRLLRYFALENSYKQKRLNKIVNREIRKFFGEVRFDLVINRSCQDHIIRLMCRRLGRKALESNYPVRKILEEADILESRSYHLSQGK